MATQYHETGQLPEGVVLAHTLHGRPDESVTHAYTASHAGVEVIPAPYSGIPYYEDDEPTAHIPDMPVELDEAAATRRAKGRERRCTAKNDTCTSWAMKGGDLCAAHAGVFRPKTPGGRGTKEWADTAEPS